MRRALALALALALTAGAVAPAGAESASSGDTAMPGPASPPGPAQPPSPHPDVTPPSPPDIPRVLPSSAQDQLRQTLNGHPEEPTPGQILLGTETLFVINSYLASIAPRIYGGAATVLLPAGLHGMQPGAEHTTAVVLVEGLAFYNLLGVDTSKMSEGEIFRTNFAAWHGIYLVNALVHHVVQRRRDGRKVVLVPLRRGIGAQTAWRF